MSNLQLALQFAIQLVVILIACRAVGALMPRIGQPTVIGEIIAGILLGPSLLGLLAPSVQGALFPLESRPLLSAVSQAGVVLYMFVVGMHLHTNFITQAYRGAMLISLGGVIVPFLLGVALASFLYADGRFFTPDVSTGQSMMYLGAAMAVTAFPVLARIIQERGIGGTTVGTLALTAGSVDDMIAWTLLGVVLASLDRSFDLVRFVASHAVFIAFVVGALLPRGRVTEALSRRIEPVASNLLVPVFFAFSGLSTELTLLWSAELVWLSVIVIVIASAGKGIGCWGAARLGGRPNREALAIGALMNARGLMELIILNIGLQRGLITPTLFTVMVMMTLVTTMAAGPLFEWAWRGTAEVADGVSVPAR
ncbi:MAG TPA: cation:proton antiporter [Vicinamibacterales bacterium]|nr:cation:proton antiporter [Vicinamibacterales bacterium]